MYHYGLTVSKYIIFLFKFEDNFALWLVGWFCSSYGKKIFDMVIVACKWGLRWAFHWVEVIQMGHQSSLHSTANFWKSRMRMSLTHYAQDCSPKFRCRYWRGQVMNLFCLTNDASALLERIDKLQCIDWWMYWTWKYNRSMSILQCNFITLDDLVSAVVYIIPG